MQENTILAFYLLL